MKLSVIIPCYNEINTIEEIIDSIKKSGVNDYEIIIVDDNSTDTTKKVLKKFKKKNFHHIIRKDKSQNHVFWVLKNQSTTI